jgi:endonuclease III
VTGTTENPDEPVDLAKLVAEAVDEAYSPRALKCWPWQHQWTMWSLQIIQFGNYIPKQRQIRQCLRCGLSKVKPVKF